ncbi:MAG: hypothetical protein ACM3X5_05650, partial [Bacillota bacterium]
IGPLFQWETGRVQWNANVLLERAIHAHNDEPHATQMGYQLQVKYRARPEFEYGIQALGDLGPWNHWASSEEQQHVLGPAIFGRVRVADRRFVRYNAGWLFGLNRGAPDNTFRMQVEYEF